ncbi:MAG TPA: alpha/beta hydrolase [Candidatus Acidoferrum sp.]|nr:alpha/beta hydrolase [Candidatus Acidoferrum sp.]
MPTVELLQSPHAPDVRPVVIHYREFGNGRPLVFLHGGWGYGVYPFDRQIEALQNEFRILIPDRSGYGHSTRVAGEMPLDFHGRAALETIQFLDALGIERAVLWGHSDGAVIGAMAGLAAPRRCECLILEAFHYLRRKPGSRAFFERFAARPEELGEEMRKLLAADHGETHWPAVLRRNCGVWFRIADKVKRPEEDLYDGRLSELRVPSLFLHGRLDPRTEPGEMERVRQELPSAEMKFVENGKHSPHSEEAAYAESNQIAREFLQAIR